jgi:ribosomal protein L32
VFHIWTKYRQGKTSEEIADEVYPHLRHEQVETAIEYAKTHPDRMAAIERERKRAVRERRRRARERKQLALGKACPHCGGQLRAGEDLPLALVWCPSCGEVHVVKRLLSDTP